MLRQLSIITHSNSMTQRAERTKIKALVTCRIYSAVPGVRFLNMFFVSTFMVAAYNPMQAELSSQRDHTPLSSTVAQHDGPPRKKRKIAREDMNGTHEGNHLLSQPTTPNTVNSVDAHQQLAQVKLNISLGSAPQGDDTSPPSTGPVSPPSTHPQPSSPTQIQTGDEGGMPDEGQRIYHLRKLHKCHKKRRNKEPLTSKVAKLRTPHSTRSLHTCKLTTNSQESRSRTLLSSRHNHRTALCLSVARGLG